MSVFSGIENEQVYSGGRYFTPGRYRVAVNQISLFDSKQKPGIKYFCVESTVLHTTSADYQEGDSVSWLVDMSKPSAKSNCKGFAVALNPGTKASDVTEDAMLVLVSPENPANGMTIDVEAYHAKARNGGEYTRMNWSCATGDWRAPAPEVSSDQDGDEDVPF
jgi:hypothetical protein